MAKVVVISADGEAGCDEPFETVDGKLFTPRLMPKGERILIRLSDVEHEQVSGRGPGNRGIVTDNLSGRSFEIHGAPCCFDSCYCDAIAIPFTR